MLTKDGKFVLSEAKIGCWNVNGVWQRINSFRYNKLHNPEVLDIITRKHIFGLIETHHTADDIGNLHVTDYKCFSICRPKDKNAKKYKPSGGLAVYVHQSIREGVSKIPLGGTESIVLKLKQQFFGTASDIYLCFAYCVPKASSVLANNSCMPQDVYEDLLDKLNQCGSDSKVILMGDMNARTQNMADFIANEDNEHVPVPPPQMYETDTVETKVRNNMDQGFNSYGPKFIDLCKTVPLRILNGRVLGDLFGKYTCHRPNGNSAVDYAAVSPCLFKSVRYFSVSDLKPHLSDHNPIELGLRVSSTFSLKQSVYTLLPKPNKVVWDRQLSDKFKFILESPDCKQSFDDFLQTGILPNQTSIDSAVEFVSKVLIKTAENAGMEVKTGAMPRGAVPRRSARVHLGSCKRKSHPKWHDLECQTLLSDLKRTSKLLNNDPKNPWLRGKLAQESKQYKRLSKFKQKLFTESLFAQLKSMHGSEPKKYMELVNSLRSGNFDKTKNSDTEAVEPDDWFDHFSSLLGKNVEKRETEIEMEIFFEQNVDKLSSELDHNFSKAEFLSAVKNTKNSKASSFDCILNEMLKAGVDTLHKVLLPIFNTSLNFNLYPTQWKKDILNPLHKSGDKTDTNNFRGIVVSSCLGKLYSSMLNNRLMKKCTSEKIVHRCQASGKEGVRTADHLLVLRHLINKYIKLKKQKMFVCFYDLKKAYDCVPRIQLFNKLLTQYKIGGKFLRILKNLYTGNEMFVKLNGGLTQPFLTTTGLKQGCIFSPLLFNLYLNDLPNVFDAACDPVYVGASPVSCLMWADDCVVMSTTQAGLQRSMDRTVEHFTSLGLSVNIKKTKVLIFNPSGHGPAKFQNVNFYINNQLVEKCDSYTYLGFIFKPSGSVAAGIKELVTKSNRAYYSMSNVLYENKKMKVDQALELFDMTVTPVCLYAVEYWGILSLPASSFNSKNSLLKAWETFLPETINQKCCRLLLSCHKKSSRLAMLGELGRYPLLVKSLVQTIKYKWSIFNNINNQSLLSEAVSEMSNSEGDNWLSRVNKIESLLGISVNTNVKSAQGVGKYVKQKIKSCFDLFWKDEISDKKVDENGIDHNKLRFYATLKNSFTREPYIDSALSRTQRAWITRLRSSSSRLGIELGRYKNIPISSRVCPYCSTGEIDDEKHLLMFCPVFSTKRACLFGKIGSVSPSFMGLSDEHKLKFILCPTSEIVTKLVNKFIRILFNARDNIDEGVDITQMCYPTYSPPFTFLNSADFDQFSDVDEWEASFSSCSSISSLDER